MARLALVPDKLFFVKFLLTRVALFHFLKNNCAAIDNCLPDNNMHSLLEQEFKIATDSA